MLMTGPVVNKITTKCWCIFFPQLTKEPVAIRNHRRLHGISISQHILTQPKNSFLYSSPHQKETASPRHEDSRADRTLRSPHRRLSALVLRIWNILGQKYAADGWKPRTLRLNSVLLRNMRCLCWNLGFFSSLLGAIVVGDLSILIFLDTCWTYRVTVFDPPNTLYQQPDGQKASNLSWLIDCSLKQFEPSLTRKVVASCRDEGWFSKRSHQLIRTTGGVPSKESNMPTCLFVQWCFFYGLPEHHHVLQGSFVYKNIGDYRSKRTWTTHHDSW